MTTIICLRTNETLFLASDMQITEGNLKLPFLYEKIVRVGDILVAGSGSVGNLQQLLRLTLKNLYINKASQLSFDKINVEELANALAETNFSLPLEHKHYSPFSYIVAGGEHLFSVGFDGSLIEIPTYYCIGSGSQLALSVLERNYKPDLKDDEAIGLILNALGSSHTLDNFTGLNCQIYGIKDGEPIIFNVKDEEPKQENAKEV